MFILYPYCGASWVKINSNFLKVRKRSDSSMLSDGALYETAVAAFFAAYVDNRHLHPVPIQQQPVQYIHACINSILNQTRLFHFLPER